MHLVTPELRALCAVRPLRFYGLVCVRQCKEEPLGKVFPSSVPSEPFSPVMMACLCAFLCLLFSDSLQVSQT